MRLFLPFAVLCATLLAVAIHGREPTYVVSGTAGLGALAERVVDRIGVRDPRFHVILSSELAIGREGDGPVGGERPDSCDAVLLDHAPSPRELLGRSAVCLLERSRGSDRPSGAPEVYLLVSEPVEPSDLRFLAHVRDELGLEGGAPEFSEPLVPEDPPAQPDPPTTRPRR